MAYDSKRYRSQSNGYMNPVILKSAAGKMLAVVEKRFPGERIVFVGKGGSGSALVTACVLLSERRVWGICSSNMQDAFSELKQKPYRIVFVDDHIGSGRTLEQVVDLVNESYNGEKKNKLDLAICITCDKLDYDHIDDFPLVILNDES